MWKRYGMSLGFTVIIIVSLIIFYSGAEKIAEENYSLQLKTISGNETEAKDVTIQGRVDVNKIPMMIDISDEESVYSDLMERDFSHYNTFDMPYYAKLHELQQQYKSFMRGKLAIDSFYEDEDQLVYVYTGIADSKGEPDFSQLSIAFYNKQNKDTSSIVVDLPAEISNVDGYIDILDVQVKNEQLLIVLNSYEKGKDSIYYASIKGGKLIDLKLLLEPKKDENLNSIYDGTVINVRKMNASNYFLISKIAWKEKTSESIETLYLIDLATAQVKELDLPASVLKNSQSVFYDDKQLVYQMSDGLWKMNLADQTTSKISDVLPIQQLTWMKEQNGKLYVLGVLQHQRHYQLMIFDLLDNKELYRGEIDSREYKEISVLELFDIHL